MLITGTAAFWAPAGVSFGSNVALSFTVIDDGDIFATAPAGKRRHRHVDRHDAGRLDHGTKLHLPGTASTVTTSVQTSTDTASGGTPITSSAAPALGTGASAVYFGDTAVTSFTVASRISSIVDVCAGARRPGTVPVSVYAPGGESGTTTFTYTTATTDTWIGGSADWGTTADWSTGSTPATGVDAVIPSGDTVDAEHVRQAPAVFTS